MKFALCLLILFITKILSQTTDKDVYLDADFERDIQPTVSPNNISEPSVPSTNIHPSKSFSKIFAEALIRGGTNIRGLMYFVNSWNGVGIHGIVCGLRPGNHGFHIHHYGSTATGGCEASGPHFTLVLYNHAGPTDKYRHAGDLGNLRADQNGVAYISQFNGQVTLTQANNTILGRAVVIHEWPDDFGVGRKDSNVTGNVGKAIACGNIGLRRDPPYFPLTCPPPNI